MLIGTIFLAGTVGIEPTSQGFGDLVATLVHAHLYLVGRGGLEPPESLNTRFTVSPATSYGLPTQELSIMVQKEGFEPSKS